jgi:N-acetylneuraminic acid mutarotase
VLIAGGETSQGPSSGILSFDPSTGKVKTIGQLPRALGHASAFTVGGELYVAGGVDGSGAALRTITGLDLKSGRIISAGKLPAPVSDAAAIVLGDQAWLFGGSRSGAVSDILLASVSAP